MMRKPGTQGLVLYTSVGMIVYHGIWQVYLVCNILYCVVHYSPYCIHNTIPLTLSTLSIHIALECSNQLKKQGQRLVEIHCYDEIRADPSGGTMDTVFHSLGQR